MKALKLRKADVGRTVYKRTWYRGQRKDELPLKEAVVSKVGTVNITIDNEQLRIVDTSEHCIVASRGHESDSYVRIFLDRESEQLFQKSLQIRKELRAYMYSPFRMSKLSDADISTMLSILKK